MKAMKELSRTGCGDALVRASVVSLRFIPGITGRLYQQFAGPSPFP